ncbi:MAG: universal stress protein [Halanaeroarchaeum sp.]
MQGDHRREFTERGGDATGRNPPANDRSVLVPVDGKPARAAFALGCDLAADSGADLTLAAPVVVPRQTPLGHRQVRRRGEESLRRGLAKAAGACRTDTTVHQALRIGHDRRATLDDIVAIWNVETVLAELVDEQDRSLFPGFSVFEAVPLGDHFDTVVASGLEGLDVIDSILVPVGRGPHSGLATELAGALARQNDAEVTLFHVTEPDRDRSGRSTERLLRTATASVGDAVDTTTEVVSAPSTAERIVERSDGTDLTIVGAPRAGILRQFVSGSMPDDVVHRSPGAVMAAYKGGADRSWIDRLL